QSFQINGAPISEELFAKRFFEVWNKLPEKSSEDLDVPRYLQLLALLSFHVFISEGVDVAIYETHLGGEYDATNIVMNPIATAVTTIAEDHAHLLGPTIENIAWHKSGIFKQGAPAFSSPQTTSVEKVLRERALERNTTLEIITPNQMLEKMTVPGMPKVQKTNCSLALALVSTYIEANINSVRQSISTAELLASCPDPIWPGRFQHIEKDGLQLYIDGAHNASGVSHAIEWFAERISRLHEYVSESDFLSSAIHNPTRILIFSHFSRRNVDDLLRCVAYHLKKNDILVHHVIFTSYNTGRDDINSNERNLQKRYNPNVLEGCRSTWEVFEERSTISICDTIAQALRKAGELASNACGAEVLVLGSLHL
ncbi:Mur ligase, partial [Aureobasidium namibiae CBS 147.97]